MKWKQNRFTAQELKYLKKYYSINKSMDLNSKTMQEQLIEAIKLWWSITGQPTEDQAKDYYERELVEYQEAVGVARLLEGGDMDWTFMQWRMIKGNVLEGVTLISDEPVIRAVIESNLSKVTKCVHLSRADAQAHARKLESKRYPKVEVLPIDGKWWVWKATAGAEAGKVLKGPEYKSKEELYEGA